MAVRGAGFGKMSVRIILPVLLFFCTVVNNVRGQVLNPPYFNLAEGRRITASSTCGEDVSGPELYCKLVGANTDKDNPNINLIQGQVCDFCDPNDPKRAHPPENAIDGSERWYQSPPLSRGNKYNEVDLTIDLGQEFHVAYIFIKMGNSPRPGVWVLERSNDNGTTFSPWQYFADSPADCVKYFGDESLQPLTKDDSVICETKFSKVVPLEGGEIVVSLLNDRPNADNFSYSPVLQEWTKATNIRLRFKRTKTLLGHLMSIARQDPTVTRRYFYSIKDINIGGRCVCNGHAETCDLTDPIDPYKLNCRCKHNTCGPQCGECCPGFQQKQWRRAIIDNPFDCEPCNCFGHSDECDYDEEIDRKQLSLDIHDRYEGGGVCKNCQHNTQGINCNECKPTYFRPYGKLLNATDVCRPCNCDPSYSTGNCEDGSGQCECRPEFLPPFCDACNYGYYGYPACRPCDCNPNGTYENICEVGGGQCPCKPNYKGLNCDQCNEEFYGFPDCLPCDCNQATSISNVCNVEDGQCTCQGNLGGRQCDRCRAGYYNYPICEYCDCDPLGCEKDICDSSVGTCLCRPGYGGPRCDRCASGYFGYPDCRECECHRQGSSSSVCDNSGRCRCLASYAGLKCDQCSPGYYSFPDCFSCDCSHRGSIGISCNNEGICTCYENFDGEKCDACREGFYNYPLCEECNCNPAGVLATFLGCGSLTSGELCECKERVTGRICNECKPLYWNLKASNSLGCEECNCFGDGTVGGIGVCQRDSGQCMCKPSVGSRQCSECKDGSYALDRHDVFGCKDCGCDIGGSVNNICDKQTGQCACRPRISGRRCNKPLQTHYFPTLFQHKFEIEDGRTPVGTQVRYGYEEDVFPGFSWRGYAVFSELQKEVLLDIHVEKSSLYEVLFHYMNFGGENVFGTITFTPEEFGDIQQSYDMVFETTMEPKFMTVSGKQGLSVSPFVLNPGIWTVSIRVEKPLFLDYLVLLPQSYYEATLIQENVTSPCSLNGNGEEKMCLNFRYPNLPSDASVMRGEDGYVARDNDRIRTNLYPDDDFLQGLDFGKMAWLDKDQHSLHLDYRFEKPGPYIVLITYHTPDGGESVLATVEVTTADRMQKGKVLFYDCTYTFPCRQVVIDQEGQVAIFDLDSNFASVILETTEDASLAIDNVALVPATLWNTDYIVPKPLCVSQNNKCTESKYLPRPEFTKTEFESGMNQDRIATILPDNIIDSDTGLIYLHEDDIVTDVHGTVPIAGLYTFVVHYYQPDHPQFNAHVVIQNGQTYEASIPLAFCPSVSGCRAVIQAKDSNFTSFQILENYVLIVKLPDDKSVWLDYVLAVPSNLFQESHLYPLHQDKAGKFIKECGEDNFRLPSNITGFCREAAFSLASEYNNGALPCHCNTDGALSFECEQFGGQCKCKPNVIGRTCSQCRTGFFGFPNCKACDCPSTAFCHPVTGQCICPPLVTGDRCDTCVPYTFGFDAIIGCEKCNCSRLGVSQGILQCDLQTGQCRCKSNVVGRTCDKCNAGYYAFPYCQLCNCDLRGSTEDICEQNTAACYCKENVYGDSCDQCKPGTFYLEETNPLGCTKCFCFGTTDRCKSSFLFVQQILHMHSWDLLGVNLENDLSIVEINSTLVEAGGILQAVLSSDLPAGTLFYFSAPSAYLGNKLHSYGGTLSYTIFTLTDRDASVMSFIGPDLILVGNDITIVHDHIEQPAEDLPLEIRINLLEREFRHISGREVTREQMMMVLVNLKHMLIRGSYFNPSLEIRLSSVLMDAAVEEYIADTAQALRVEQCLCPDGYTGYSCEECAPGHYRAKTGPYLGYCVPCQCNGHTQTCDVKTGKCANCKHNTVGDYCERCGPGYHGDATQGTPYDCLICACPLPIETNNFADSCEVSPSGLEISCSCKPGYIGARCSACAAGYYGRPEVPGSYCQPCRCSGNIDPSLPGSCDSVTGECVLCLNNTFGAACELCAPGFYGDAIGKKDCARCNCDECGTDHCDNANGECVCWPNVEGSSCDHCAPYHWGFRSCAGCRHCNCGPASISEQCDIETGQCSCKPGAGGLTCDICEPGYYKYTSDGCSSCNCDEKYSAGVVCDTVSGQCQCLPGVIGEKCDSCPYRWVFIKNEGCLECGPCVHSLLDETDLLNQMIEPVMLEMQDISTSYFANRRLQNVNKTCDNLRVAVDALILDPSGLDFSPLVYDVQFLEKTRDQLDKNSSRSLNQAREVASESNDARELALEVEKLIRDTIEKARMIVSELGELSDELIDADDPNVEYLLAEAEMILTEIKERDFEPSQNASAEELDNAKELLERCKSFEIPSLENKEMFDDQNKTLRNLIDLIEELRNNSQNAIDVANKAKSLEFSSRGIPVKKYIDEIDDLSSDVEKILEDALEFLEKAMAFANDAEDAYNRLEGDVEDSLKIAVRDLKDSISDLKEDLAKDIKPLTDQAIAHADSLTEQAGQLDKLLADTRHSSDAAVQAAKAYGNIVKAINDALIAAQSAVSASVQAGTKSDGVAERADDSKERSVALLDEARQLLDKVSALEPQLENAKEGVTFIAQQNGKTSRGLDVISKELDKLPLNTLSALAGHAAESSEIADNNAKNARDKIHGIADRLPEDELRAEEIPKSVEDTRQAMKAIDNYLDKVSSIIPETSDLMERAGKRESSLKIIGVDVADKIAQLQQKVALARNQASRIKLGIQFFENSTLQVRNPEGMQRAATYTQMSLYFRTTERFGLLAYVGNEVGAHAQMKRVRTDDYLALQIRGGYIVLTMDLGSGAQEIMHSEYVSDGDWHQVTLERTGKTCSITVRTEDKPDSVIEGALPGAYSVFNLNQQISKVFIGGVPEHVKLQETIKSRSFEGCIEEVEFGKIPIGLWDFVQAENIFEGCQERDKLTVLVTSNGLRFDGHGYVILPRRKLNFGSETFIKMRFKTYAPEALLFLIGKKNDDFFALELREGQAVLKFELGSGMAELKSGTTYNDGEWHILEATREGNEAILKVDNVEVASGVSPGSQNTLSVTNQIFVGGHSGSHPYEAVTNVGFEGCIVDMQISADIIDLNKNKEALGVVNGCPVTIARTVSFANDSLGYVAMPRVNLDRISQITFKFKTVEENGLIFYVANDDQSKYLLIGLENGMVVMRSEPGGEIRSSSDIKYNDKEWHYISATQAVRQMRLDIDDIDSIETELDDDADITITTPLYFGGVPANYLISNDVPISAPFIGCLGDTTVNNKFQNFADTQDRLASLASCPLDEKYDASDFLTPKLPEVTSPSTTIEKEGDEVDEDKDEDMSTEPTPPEPTPFEQCALPLPPRTERTKPQDGIRFGNTKHSRLEIAKPAIMQTIEDDSTFSLEFKTTMSNGVLFYVAGNRHIDFIGLFLLDGKVVYAFNCGAGSAVISSQNSYNNGTWHKAVFSRQGTEGMLVIDDDEEVRGTSPGAAFSVNVRPPFFVGGLSEHAARQAKNNLKGVSTSFPGCIRNVEAQGESLGNKKTTVSHNTTGCSNKIEEGTFISMDGGYLIPYDKYRVGKKIHIELSIKPRSLSGVLLAVHHGNADYLLLQMLDGRISFSVDNGDGPITAVVDPKENQNHHYLCDGEWHTITVAKVSNVVSLSVDGLFNEPVIGKSSVSSTDTNDPMYVGGLPDPSSAKGVETLEQFAGCISKLTLNGKVQDLSKSRVFGNVRLNTCPTI